MNKIVLFLLSFLPIQAALGCDCMDKTTQKAIEEAYFIYSAKAVSADTTDFYQRTGLNTPVTFTKLLITKVYKGGSVLKNELNVKDTIVLLTRSWLSCDFHFELNKQYLIYMSYPVSEFTSIHKCSHSKQIQDASQDLKVLASYTEPKIDLDPSLLTVETHPLKNDKLKKIIQQRQRWLWYSIGFNIILIVVCLWLIKKKFA